jgi:hypothetical protein
MSYDFKKFDRELEDLREAFFGAAGTMHHGVKRYVAMLEALDTMFVLSYEDLLPEDKRALKTALDKLFATAADFADDDPPKVVPIAKKPAP